MVRFAFYRIGANYAARTLVLRFLLTSTKRKINASLREGSTALLSCVILPGTKKSTQQVSDNFC